MSSAPRTLEEPPQDHYLRRELYALVQSDHRIFEFLQAGSLDGIWYWDVTDQDQEWMSPRFKELFGYSDEEIPNTSRWWQENIHPEDLQLALDNFAAHMADPGHPYDQIVRYRHRDGSDVWVRCRGLAIRDDDGNPIRMLGAHSDVTELMQARAQLEGAEERWRTAFQGAPIGMAISDMQGRFIEVNRAFCEVLGYEAEELRDLDFSAVTHPDDVDAGHSLLEAIVAGERETVQIEKRYLHRSGRIIPAVLSVSAAHDPDGTPRNLIAQIEDSTERKRAEAELLRSNRELEQFAYAASHDLKAPVRQLTTATELLGRHLDPALLDDKTRSLIEIMVSSTDRMNSLIDALLELAKIGGKRDDHETVNSSALLAEAGDAVADQLIRAGGEIVMPEVGVDFDGHPGQLGQLFVNLFANAITYREPERPLLITVEVERLRDGAVRFIVGDNGSGIDPAQADRAFQIFKRLDPKRAPGGTGLGLAICRRVAEAHSGWLELIPERSGSGVGTFFEVVLGRGPEAR